ncbi:MAG: hypothetical protein NC408_06615 [Candidatus Gastranaerophilales bacterium]|nr:hypothetical protein [Candidatus Gastranaerophilales bacterium]MCM1072798.1 hypothetical protein [Bacteroides sp.]
MDLLREGQKVTIYFQKDSNMVEMSCEIEKLYDDRMDLVLPQYFMRYVEFLQVGAKLTAKVFSKLGTIDFNTVIISSPLEDNFTIELDYNSLKLTAGSEIPKIEAVEKLEIKLQDEIYTTKTFEISTEYIKFNSDKKLIIGESLDCTLKLPKTYGIINFRAAVSEIDAIYSNEITANISTMTENDRQNLLYYMYVYTTNSD